MKFAISYNTAYHGVDPDRIMAFAQHAEDCGFESLYLSEHIALYPGAMIGPTAIPPSLPYADPLDGLSFVAATTQRILLGTGVLLLPYHHPVVLAKRLATIDVLSKGRMRLLTVGLGTLPGEARAVGLQHPRPSRRRGHRRDATALGWWRRRRQLRRGVLRLRRPLQFPEAAWGRAPADPHRRIESGGRTPRRATRRRLLSWRRAHSSRARHPDGPRPVGRHRGRP